MPRLDQKAMRAHARYSLTPAPMTRGLPDGDGAWKKSTSQSWSARPPCGWRVRHSSRATIWWRRRLMRPPLGRTFNRSRNCWTWCRARTRTGLAWSATPRQPVPRNACFKLSAALKRRRGRWRPSHIPVVLSAAGVARRPQGRRGSPAKALRTPSSPGPSLPIRDQRSSTL